MQDNIGRESSKDNDCFYMQSDRLYCKENEKYRMDVAKYVRKTYWKIYDLADVYHSDNIDRVSDDFIVESGMKEGNFDNVKACGYAIPSHWDIGKVYKGW